MRRRRDVDAESALGRHRAYAYSGAIGIGGGETWTEPPLNVRSEQERPFDDEASSDSTQS
jgi:hypothetical protein